MSARVDRRSPEAAIYRRLYKSARWLKLRAEKLRANPLCERDHGNRAVAATIVNHRIPHRGLESLFWDWMNLQSLCKPCHDGFTQSAERRGFSPEVDADGYPIDPSHPANATPG